MPTGDPSPRIDFEIGAVLGRGGMGVVFAGRQTALDREVAIKTLAPEAPGHAIESLVAEARFMGQLEHPNVVPVHALTASEDGIPQLVMKRIDGVDWDHLIRDPAHPAWASWRGTEQEPLARHVELLAEVCRAVELAHERGIIHCDIKPANVRLGSSGEVFLMDWGAASAHPGPPPETIVGTPAYMAPEMVLEAVAAPRTDVFLLGACLFTALTGRPPNAADTVEGALIKAATCDPPELPPDTPPRLAAACRRAMARDPEQRHASAEAFRTDLQSWLRGRTADRLVEAAERALTRLEQCARTEDHAGASAAFAEARFGLEQALAEDADHAPSRSALVRALTYMCSLEQNRGNLHQAVALCRDLEALGSDVSARRRELEAMARQPGRFRTGNDAEGRRARNRVVMWIGVAFGLALTANGIAAWALAAPVHHVLAVDLSLATVGAIPLAFVYTAMGRGFSGRTNA